MGQNFRIGVIGLGGVADAHLSAYRALQHVRVVSVCDLREDVARSTALRLSANAYTDYRALLSDGGLDLALVLTPASTHREIVEAAAQAGIHVLCEKPLALSLADGHAMADACRLAGVKLFYGSCYRLWRGNQDETRATIWMRFLGRGRDQVIMLIAADKFFVVF